MSTTNSGGPSNIPTHLTPSQLRRLEDYLENKCLELTRGVRKRNEPDTPYKTLSAYVAATSSLVTMILLIPPAKSSASIRTAWLLRITGDIFENIPAYSLGTVATSPPRSPNDQADQNEQEHPPPQPMLSEEGLATLEEVFCLLEKLDAGWCAIIRNERWDSTVNQGIFEESSTAGDQSNVESNQAFSVTDSTRLRSIIVSGKDEFDDWLVEQGGGDNFDIVDRSVRVMSHALEEIGQNMPVPIQPGASDSEDDFS
ncbi:hypothetical protein CTheo_1301 [Ceratobasidium theobromae]|uniref:Uncharacterized protein n=1 Tax=Ceratobasidium theobromae TaxID=1582974 RepID=A0A5N5QUK0_9AGAM|nr:hypothetical protein CTheo_1301 [Ceratobasidium theobromae]